MNLLRKHLSVANVLSCVALFVALSGAAYAATTLGKKSVKTKNLANGAVTTLKLRGGAVTNLKLRNGAVTGAKIAPATIGSSQLASGAVRSAQLGGGVVTEGKLKDGAVTEKKLAAGVVGNAKLAANSVSAGKLQDGAVTSAKLSSSLLAGLVKNVSYVDKASPTDSEPAKSATIECPAGKQAVGGGARVVGTVESVALTESSPFATDGGKRTGWTAAAREIPSEAGEWAVQAYAVCAEF